MCIIMAITCFMTGNHDAPQEIYPRILAEVKRHITEFGVAEFFVGAYGSFDSMAKRAVIEAKRTYPDVRLTLVMHYLNCRKYEMIQKEFDGSIYPDGLERSPMRFAIVRGNRIMAENTDFLIIYSANMAGNTRRLMDYAAEKNIMMTEIK